MTPGLPFDAEVLLGAALSELRHDSPATAREHLTEAAELLEAHALRDDAELCRRVALDLEPHTGSTP